MKSRDSRSMCAASIGLATMLMSVASPGGGQKAALTTGDIALNDLGKQKRPRQAAGAAPTPTSELIVFLQPDVSAEAFALINGLRPVYPLRSDPNGWVFTATSIRQADTVRALMGAHPVVRELYLNEKTHKVPFAFVPNDPYFPLFGAGSGQPGQWHLINQITAGRDAGVQGAWNRDITGQGVVIGIVDDCLQTTHPDLAPNYIAAYSWNFGQNNANPDPVNGSDIHGISVAGVAAARGNNGVGGTGAAPYASLAGLRIDFPTQTTAMFVDATRYLSTGANTAIKIKNHSYGYSLPYLTDTSQSNAASVSASVGTIHCFAAGNNRGTTAQDSNKMDTPNNPDVITVAAMGSNGIYASYSNFGACVFVTAPSNTNGGFGILTTDRTGAAGYNGLADQSYTNSFGGTSSACPLVAGVLALVKQVQPALNVRFAKHLLARNSDIVDAADASVTSDGGWKTNGTGLKFNQNYGFGKINADRLTRAAVKYTGVTTLTTVNTGTITVSAAIPDNSTAGISRTFVINATEPLEEMLVFLSVIHPYRGDVIATLRSPSGVSSRLMIQSSGDSEDNVDWTFSTNAFWGENPQGTWTLTVADLVSGDTGTWNAFSATARMGKLVPRKVSGTVMLEDAVNQAQQVTLDFRAVSGGENFSRTLTLSPSGVFEVSEVPAGVYDIAVKGAKWLRKVLENIDASSGSVAGINVTLKAGDANADNSADVLDLDTLIQSFDQCDGDPGFLNGADFNCDGCADVLDLDLLLRNFDTVGDE